MEITVQYKGNIVVLSVSGEIDINASELVERVGWCIRSGFKDILCNFEEVNFVDYEGLSVLTIAYKNVINNKCRIKFVNVPVYIRRLFELVHMDSVFEVYDNMELALNAFKEDRAIAEIQSKKLRRRFRRLHFEQAVEYWPKRAGGKPHKGKILNLSAIGALIFCDKIYPLGEVITLRLDLKPHLPKTELEAKVVWHVSRELQHEIYPGMGVEFHRIDSDTQAKIVAFVERNLAFNKDASGSTT